MGKQRSWSDEELAAIIPNVISYRAVLLALGLVPAGGNYEQVKRRVAELNIAVDHFTGKGWNTGLAYNPNPAKPLQELLVRDNRTQSHVLKKRLFVAGIKTPQCELCGWAEKSEDGRIPIELDHINGDHYDNRIENLRILCPNCHSLQPTHRGRNKRVRLIRLQNNSKT